MTGETDDHDPIETHRSTSAFCVEQLLQLRHLLLRRLPPRLCLLTACCPGLQNDAQTIHAMTRRWLQNPAVSAHMLLCMRPLQPPAAHLQLSASAASPQLGGRGGSLLLCSVLLLLCFLRPALRRLRKQKHCRRSMLRMSDKTEETSSS
jgi:hypothetical protein